MREGYNGLTSHGEVSGSCPKRLRRLYRRRPRIGRSRGPANRAGGGVELDEYLTWKSGEADRERGIGCRTETETAEREMDGRGEESSGR